MINFIMASYTLYYMGYNIIFINIKVAVNYVLIVNYVRRTLIIFSIGSKLI